MRARRRWVLAAVLAAALAACGGDDPAPPSGDAPITVAGRAITEAEIERAAARVALLYPKRSREFHARSALESFLLPRAAVQNAFPEARALAEERCRAAFDALERGDETVAAEAHEIEGNLDDLTLLFWSLGRELEPGAWSEPTERIGSFSIVQLVERRGYEVRESQEELALRVLDFSYLPDGFGPEGLADALSAAELRILDPDVSDLIPETLRYQMKGDRQP